MCDLNSTEEEKDISLGLEDLIAIWREGVVENGNYSIEFNSFIKPMVKWILQQERW